MSFTNKSVIDINDFSDEEIKELFSVTDRFLRDGLNPSLLRHKLMANLFYEPSTRSQFSFDAAMKKQGGETIGFSGIGGTSISKGESLADTIRIITAYDPDLIVLRHYNDGSVLAAKEFTEVPIINAGDGAHQHPTQTLYDLFTILKYKGYFDGLNVVFYGDLKKGRTVHSLSYPLAERGANLTFVSLPGLEMPAHMLSALQGTGSIDIADSLESVIGSADVLYVTRLQKERFNEAQLAQIQEYCLSEELLKRAGDDMILMHPLPRVDEIPHHLDKNKRSVYFTQAKYGFYLRAALLSLILGALNSESGGKNIEIKAIESDNQCQNQNCVTNHETYLSPKYLQNDSGLLCMYCKTPSDS